MLTTKQLPEALRLAMSIDVTCLILGPPGCGKTSVIEQLSKEDNLEPIIISLSQTEPGDLLGYAKVNEAINKFQYIVSELIPIETDPLPEGKDGWCLFLDDATNGLPAVQVACYRIIQERMVGNHKIHPKCRIVAAGNRDEDGCYTYTMPTAFRSKVMILQLEADPNIWLDHAYQKGFDYRVVTYITAYKDKLNGSSELSEDLSYPCSRTWERVSKLIKDKNDISSAIMFNCISGLIGKSAATHFLAFVKYFDKIPTYQEILDEPTKTPVPKDGDVGLLWATIGMILNSINISDDEEMDKELTQVLIYLDRSSKEYLLSFLQLLKDRKESVIYRPLLKPYIQEIRGFLS